MMKFSNRSIEDIKDGVSLVDIIGQDVPLKREGNNWVGLCPFHNEKTPSFKVEEEKRFFKCFGCDAKGDVFPT